MKPEAMRIAIAHYRALDEGAWLLHNGSRCASFPPGLLDKDCGAGLFPPYEEDLQSLHPVVAMISRERYDADDGFSYHLARVVHGQDADDVGWNFYEMQEATARQRAEAFLKTIGKWAEEKEAQ